MCVLHLPTYTHMLTWTSTLMPARHTHTNMHILIHISANIHEQTCANIHMYVWMHVFTRKQTVVAGPTLDDKGCSGCFVHLEVGGRQSWWGCWVRKGGS